MGNSNSTELKLLISLVKKQDQTNEIVAAINKTTTAVDAASKAQLKALSNITGGRAKARKTEAAANAEDLRKSKSAEAAKVRQERDTAAKAKTVLAHDLAKERIDRTAALKATEAAEKRKHADMVRAESQAAAAIKDAGKSAATAKAQREKSSAERTKTTAKNVAAAKIREQKKVAASARELAIEKTRREKAAAVASKATAKNVAAAKIREQKKVAAHAKAQERQKMGAASGLRLGMGLGGGLLVTQTAMQLTQGMGKLVKLGVQWNSTIEQTQIALTTLLGDAGKAQTRIDELIDFAAFTPFELPEIIQVNRLLENMSKGALSSAEGMRLVGDAAAATGAPLQNTAFWIGRVYAGLSTGTPVGEATLRLVELGLITGTLKIKLDNLAKSAQGQAKTMDILRESFAGTAGAMELQSRTLKGLMATFRDTFGKAAGDEAELLFYGLKKSLEAILVKMGALDTVTGTFLTKLKEIPENASKAAKAIQSKGDSVASFVTDKDANTTWLDDQIKQMEELGAKKEFIEKKLQQIEAAPSSPAKPIEGNAFAGLSEHHGLREEWAARKAMLAEIKAELGNAVDETEKDIEGKLKELAISYHLAMGALAREIREAQQDFSLSDDYDELNLRRITLTDKKGSGRTRMETRELDLIQIKLKDLESAETAILKRTDAINAAYKLATQTLHEQVAEKAIAVAKIDEEKSKLTALFHDEKARELAWKEAETQKQKLLKESEKLVKQITKAEKKTADERMKAVREQVDAEKLLLSAQLDAISTERKLLSADFTQTEADKFPQLLQFYREEIRLIDEVIAKLDIARGNTTDPAAQELIGGEINNLRSDKQDAEVSATAADPNNFSQQWDVALTNLRDQWGTTEEILANGMTDVVQTAMDGMTDSIMGLIDGTQTWGQAFSNVGRQIIKQMIGIGVQMAVTKALSSTLNAAATTEQITTQAAMTPVLATNAGLQATISFGAAPALGTMLLLAGLGAVLAFALTSFNTGGWTGDGDPSKPSGIVENQEFVMNRRATSMLGKDMLAEMNATGRIPDRMKYSQGASASASGGLAGALASAKGSEGNAAPVFRIANFSDELSAKDWAHSEGGKTYLINLMKEHFWEVSDV